MSNSVGRAFFADGTVLWFEYQGSGDSARPLLFATEESYRAAFRSQDHMKVHLDRKMVAQIEPVILESFYGGCFWWVASAVRFPCCQISVPGGNGKDITAQIAGMITTRHASSELGWDCYEWCEVKGLFRPVPADWDEDAEVTGPEDFAEAIGQYRPNPSEIPAWLHEPAADDEKSFGSKIGTDDRRALLTACGRTFVGTKLKENG